MVSSIGRRLQVANPLGKMSVLILEFQVALWTHLELIHYFPDGFASGTNDPGVHTVIQWDVLRNHLLKLTHNLQDSIPGSFRVLLIPCDGDLVLGLKKRMQSQKRVAPLGHARRSNVPT